MGINTKFIVKFDEAYKDIPATIVPIEFLPSSPYYHMEEWREVLPMFVPGVVPHTYWISSHGRIYTSLRSPSYPNGGIMSHSINQRGYHQINLKSLYGKKICVKISRLILLHFRFVPNCHLLEVDHLDGDKDNNCLWNLEWVIPQENTNRAIIYGQRPISCRTGYYENGPDNINYYKMLPDEQARSLFIEYVQNGVSKEELIEKYQVTDEYIDLLAKGSIRSDIYKEYIANKIKQNNPMISSK